MFSSLPLLMGHRSKDSIENIAKGLADIFGEKSKHEETIFLEKMVFPTIATIGIRIVQMLGAVQFNRHAQFGTKQVHFHGSPTAERNG